MCLLLRGVVKDVLSEICLTKARKHERIREGAGNS